MTLTRVREGAGEPLLLLHGLGLSWRTWKPLLRALAARHEVLALDLPGFGTAPPAAAAPSIEVLADAVERELDEAGIDRAHAAGNSMGGSIALELARRGRATRVVVLGPAGMETPAERLGVIALNESQRAAYRLAAPAAELVAANPVTRSAVLGWLHGRPWRVAAADGAAEIRDFAGAPAFHAALRRVTGAWAPAELAGVRVPVRVCVGSRDVLIGAPNAPRFVAAIPGAALVPLPGCGHVPMADDPALVARAILGDQRPASQSAPRA
jgi:pimeloyl-ACP methyl ester carboxylesterase